MRAFNLIFFEALVIVLLFIVFLGSPFKAMAASCGFTTIECGTPSISGCQGEGQIPQLFTCSDSSGSCQAPEPCQTVGKCSVSITPCSCSVTYRNCGDVGCASTEKYKCTNCGDGWSCSCVSDSACGGGGGGGGCTTTVPTGLSAVKTGNPATYQFSWTPGTGGSQHILSICTNSAMTTCPYVYGSATSPKSVSLNTGTYYYWKVVNDTTGTTCDKSVSGTAFLSSCSSSQTSLSLKVGQTLPLVMNVNSSTAVGKTTFTEQTTCTTSVNCSSYPTIDTCVPGACQWATSGTCSGANSACAGITDSVSCRNYSWTGGSCSGVLPGCNTYSTQEMCQSSGCRWTPLTQFCTWNDTSSCIRKTGYLVSSCPAVTINPATDTAYVYQTSVTGIAENSGASSSYITNNVYNAANTAIICTTQTPLVVTAPGPWWQVKDGDVTTNGDLMSELPFTSTYLFGLAGDGGFPGIPAYGGTTNLNSTRIDVSATGWLANSPYASTKVYNSTYFANSIPKEAQAVTVSLPSVVDQTSFNGATQYSGAYWYEYDASKNGGADLTISGALNFGSNKVVLIVKGADVYVNKSINITKGSGFFIMIAGVNSGGGKGNIIVSPTLGSSVSYSLEGIYVADGLFQTGTTGLKNDLQLRVRGTVAAYGGVSLQRDLGSGNGTTPAEYFEYAPDLELLFPAKLGLRPMSWREVAP